MVAPPPADKTVGEHPFEIVADLQAHLLPHRVDDQQHAPGGPGLHPQPVVVEQLHRGAVDVPAPPGKEHRLEVDVQIAQQHRVVAGQPLPGRGVEQAGGILEKGVVSRRTAARQGQQQAEHRDHTHGRTPQTEGRNQLCGTGRALCLFAAPTREPAVNDRDPGRARPARRRQQESTPWQPARLTTPA